MKYVYRAVNALIGILTILAAFFVRFIGIEISTGSSLESFFNKLTDDAAGRVGIMEELSIKRIVDIVNGKDEYSFLLEKLEGKPFLWPKELHPLNTRLIVFAVSFVLIILIALFVIIWSCCSNKRIPVLAAGVAALILSIVLIVSFRSAATDIANGTVGFSDFVISKVLGSGTIANLIGGFAGGAVVFIFTLCGLQNAFVILSIALIIWTVMFYLVDLGDPEVKQEKEAKKNKKQ